MPTLSFEGETHDEIVRKVRRWLASIEGVHEESHITIPVAVERATELTKDALTVIAQAAPGPIARSEIFKGLTRMGYDATENTKRAVINGLDRRQRPGRVAVERRQPAPHLAHDLVVRLPLERQ